jgi:hypothetical protein
MKVRRTLLLAGLALLLVLPLALLGPRPALAELSRPVRQQVMKAVVQIWAMEETRSGYEQRWWGSGSIITEDGLILTNCHVAYPEAMGGPSYDVLVVYLTLRSDQPPQPTYIAEVVQYDPNLDLAVIRVTKTVDGNPVDPKKLNLPTVPLGDSDDTEIGDKLYIFGYPVTGGETISYVEGVVSGFSSERSVGGRAWIKTDASIAGGNSGGTAVNDSGELVGVPTQMGSGSEDPTVPLADCRYIQDTNGDGTIDERDTCIYTGFFNALRPVNLAKPMIQAADAGLGPQPTPEPTPEPEPTGRAAVSRLFFAPDVNEGDMPISVVESFPAGTNAMFLFFDYANFQNGVDWQPVLIYEGTTYTDVWALSPWDGGLEGSWWLSIHNEPLPDGAYQFDLYYHGKKIGSAKTTVGGKAQNAPAFSDITFSDGEQTGFLLPAGITKLTAYFDYSNMTAQTKWSYVWYYQGKEVARDDGSGLKGNDQGSVYIGRGQGLDAGTYRLEMYIAGKLAATSDVVLGGKSDGGDGGTNVFGPITFAEGVDKQDKPVKPGTAFKSGITTVYGFFDYQGMQDGLSWTRRWYLDGRVVVDVDDTWGGGESGNRWVGVNNGRDALPDGTYDLELLVEGSTVQQGTCTIGKTGKPTPTPTVPPQEGVDIYGTITDADTGRGIAGALFIVLQPGITVDQFQWTEEEVYSLGQADRKGNYQLSAPLVRGETYSIIVGADGYDMIAEDDVFVPEDLESPYQLDVTLQKSQ